MFTATTLLPALFTLSTLFGVFVHDSQLDRAAVTLTAPMENMVSSVDNALRLGDQHPHEEAAATLSRSGGLSTQLSIQPRSIDRKYALPKRPVSHSATGGSLWPSI